MNFAATVYHVKPERVSSLTAEEHIDIIHAALLDCKMNPYDLLRHYVHAALKTHGTVSAAARAVGIPRKTMQRILEKRLNP